MKVTILGTAAAEAWPGLFCACDACREARRRGGPNIRRRTSYLLDDETLIDFGPDINWQCNAFGIDLSAVRRILFTHSHHDHLEPGELQWRKAGFSKADGVLDLYGNEHVFERIRRESRYSFAELALVQHLLRPGVSMQAGPLDVLPVEADHADRAETALNLVIRSGEAGLLIANDTGWWPERSWEQVRGLGLGAAVIECTYLHQNPEARHHHMGVQTTIAFRDRLLQEGALRPDAQVLTAHFSHNGGTLHEELCSVFEPANITVAYDGLVLSV